MHTENIFFLFCVMLLFSSFSMSDNSAKCHSINRARNVNKHNHSTQYEKKWIISFYYVNTFLASTPISIKYVNFFVRLAMLAMNLWILNGIAITIHHQQHQRTSNDEWTKQCHKDKHSTKSTPNQKEFEWREEKKLDKMKLSMYVDDFVVVVAASFWWTKRNEKK